MKVYEHDTGPTLTGSGAYLGDVWFDELAATHGHRAWHAERRTGLVGAFDSEAEAIAWLRETRSDAIVEVLQ